MHRALRRLVLAAPAVAVLAAGNPAVAAPSGDLELSFLVAPGGTYGESSGFDPQAAFGLGLGWHLASAWTLELRGLTSDDDVPGARLDQWALDLAARRGLRATGTWQPFLATGVRYWSREIERDVVCVGVRAPCPRHLEARDEIGPFLGGGLDWLLTRRAALRFEGRLAFYDSAVGSDLESDFDASAGFVLRF